MKKRIGFCCFLWMALPPAQAEGFRNPPPGSFGLGRAGGRYAHIDGAAAVAHNPANLVGLDSAQAAIEPAIIYIGSEFRSPGGATAETRSPWKVLPHMFAALPLQGSGAVLGLGFTSPYGLSNEWERQGAFAPGGPLRYTAPYFTELKTINFNPTLAFPLGENVSFGLGVNLMWSELTFEQYFPWALFAPGSPDGEMKARGDGLGFGANFGLAWQATKRQRFGAALRTPIKIHYDGAFHDSNALPGLQAPGTFRSAIEFPLTIGLGYGFQVNPDLRLELGVERVHFSSFDQLPLGINAPAIRGFPVAIQEDWKDTWTIGLGGDWRWNDHWTFRASYQFYQSPIPDHTLSPTIPDANQNVITMGVEYRRGAHSVEAAFGEVFYEDRRITNNGTPAFNGDYQTTVHLFSLAYRLSF